MTRNESIANAYDAIGAAFTAERQFHTVGVRFSLGQLGDAIEIAEDSVLTMLDKCHADSDADTDRIVSDLESLQDVFIAECVSYRRRGYNVALMAS